MKRLTKTRMAECEFGWFGCPGERSTRVHIVHGPNRRPICGTTLMDKLMYQFCGRSVYPKHIECGNCKRVWAKLAAE